MSTKDELDETMDIARSLRATIRELLERTEQQNAIMKSGSFGPVSCESEETIDSSGNPEG